MRLSEAGTGDEADRVIENRLKEYERCDRGDEGDQEQHPGSQRDPSVGVQASATTCDHYDLMARDRQVARRVGTHLVVPCEREVDVREAVLVAALTQEGDRIPHLELARLRGNPLVRITEHILHAHARTPLLAGNTSLPIPITSNLIANQRPERLELVTQLVQALGHQVIARELEVEEVREVTRRERPDVALVG
jgi:hypothetical protein